MKKIIVLIFLITILSFLHAIPAWAHQPREIRAYKDIKNNIIHVHVRHPNKREPDKLYIKRVELFIDESTEPLVKSFTIQRGPYRKTFFQVDDLESISKILIKAYPAKGKLLEKEFLVSEMEEL